MEHLSRISNNDVVAYILTSLMYIHLTKQTASSQACNRDIVCLDSWEFLPADDKSNLFGICLSTQLEHLVSCLTKMKRQGWALMDAMVQFLYHLRQGSCPIRSINLRALPCIQEEDQKHFLLTESFGFLFAYLRVKTLPGVHTCKADEYTPIGN